MSSNIYSFPQPPQKKIQKVEKTQKKNVVYLCLVHAIIYFIVISYNTVHILLIVHFTSFVVTFVVLLLSYLSPTSV